MKRVLCLFSLSVLVTGCSAPLGRVLVDAGAGAGGAVIGNALSGGDLGFTALGGAGGVALAEGARELSERAKQRHARDTAESILGREAKSDYWRRQQEHRGKESSGSQFYPVPLPERVTPDGVRLEPGVQWIEIRK